MATGRSAVKWGAGGLAPAITGMRAVQKPEAPEVTFTTLKGEEITMQSLRGKVVWVIFRATSCSACIEKMPDLSQTYTKFKPKGFEVIALAMKYDPPNYVQIYQQSGKLPFPVALDPQGETARAFGDVQLTSTAVLVDKQGLILQTIVGVPDFQKVHALLEDELSPPGQV